MTGNLGPVQLRKRGLFPDPPTAPTAAETFLEFQGNQDLNGLLLLAPTFIGKKKEKRAGEGNEGTQLCSFLSPTLSLV